VAAKSLIKNGKLDGEVERKTADRGTEITLSAYPESGFTLL
jgi:hypothetical protein